MLYHTTDLDNVNRIIQEFNKDMSLLADYLLEMTECSYRYSYAAILNQTPHAGNSPYNHIMTTSSSSKKFVYEDSLKEHVNSDTYLEGYLLTFYSEIENSRETVLRCLNRIKEFNTSHFISKNVSQIVLKKTI